MKCSHTLLEFGIVSFVSCETGEVLDFEVVSKHWSKCKLHRSKLSPEEFKEWFQEHKNSDKCQINYKCYSVGMEQDAMIINFKRSKSNLKLRYISFLGEKWVLKWEVSQGLNYHLGVKVKLTNH